MFEIVFLVLLAILGWLLGVVGFFRAGRALKEVQRLRTELGLVPPSLAVAAGGPVVAPNGMLVMDPAMAPPVANDTPDVPPAEDLPTEAAPTPAPPPPRVRKNLEEAITQRFGLWLGALALLLSAVFLIRFGIEEGWLGPAVRSAMAALLGLLLVAGAEALARRHPTGGAPDRAPAALAAGGVAGLFGAGYAAGPLYGLLAAPFDFAALGLAGIAGLLLALRFGPLVGVVGLLGGYVTPALVASASPFLPGLYIYLLVVTAAAAIVLRFTAWTPLGALAALGVAGWAAVGGQTAVPEAGWAPALFVPAAVAVLLFALPRGVGAVAPGRLVAGWSVVLPGLALLALSDTWPWAGAAALLAFCLAAILRAAPEPGLIRLPWYAAAIAVVAMALWSLPLWSVTGEAVTVEGVVAGFIPGAWVPEALEPWLATLGLLAVLHLVAGLRLGARATGWAGLGGAMPVALLLVGFARVRGFQPDPLWAAAGVVLAAVLVGAAGRAMRQGRPAEAGEWAAGAVGALALGAGMLLTDQWLSAALGLLLPALAWIGRRTGLVALRRVAALLALGVLVRLVLNPAVAGYAVGEWPVLNGLAVAYLVPAFSAAWAAHLFGGAGRAMGLLRGVSVIAAVAGVAVLIRHGMAGDLGDDRIRFADVAAQCGAAWLLAAGFAVLARRWPSPTRVAAQRVLGGIGLLLLTALLLGNPGLTDEKVPGVALWNPLLAAYAVPGVLAGLAALRTARRWLAVLLGGLALASGLTWVVLEVRRAAQGARVGFDAAPFGPVELWAISGGWLLLAIALFALGLRARRRGPRLAALAVIGIATMKVFLVDMGELDGLWRVLSFLGLGLALIGLGSAYRRFVTPRASGAP